MVHRDPQTGKFVAGDSFNDIEVVTFRADVGVEAANLDGGTGFGGEFHSYEGLQIIDYDEVVDRNEKLVLLEAQHSLDVQQNSTTTADGTVGICTSISASPARKDVTSVGTPTGSLLQGSNDQVVGTARQEDSIDLVGRPLQSVAHAPFSDGVTGVGGAGSAGHDSVELTDLPEQVAEFHPRDELFSNGVIRTWNIADGGVHGHVQGQHVYGVVSE